MRGNLLRLLSAALVGSFCYGLAAVEALTVYRIGGEDLPPPEVDGDFEFIQLSWADVDEKQLGRIDLLEVATHSIEPQRLDPAVNLTPLIRERGGGIRSNNSYGWQSEALLDFLMDGDLTTAYLGSGRSQSADCSPCKKGIWFELKGLFPIRRIKISTTERFAHQRFIEVFEIGTNDGDSRKKGTREGQYHWRGAFLDYDVVFSVANNLEPFLDLELPDRPIAEILFKAPVGNWEIAEFEIFGDGFASQASYVSNVIDLGMASSLGELTWSGSRDQGATVNLSMRSGDDTDPNFYWRFTFRGDERSRFAVSGEPLTLDRYKRLEEGEKAGISPDNESWEFWTPPLDFDRGHSELVGLRPRRYLQFKADFLSERALAAGRMEYLQFNVSQPPVASQVLAEIVPHQVEVGEVVQFIYKILPNLEQSDLGFDSIEIDTPIEVTSIDAVYIGGEEQDFTIAERDAKSFVVQVPRIDLNRTGELVEVEFQAEVFQVGTVFSGRVFDSQLPHEVRQRITAGNADDLAESNTLSVGLSTVANPAVKALWLAPRLFTPNGDGVNDLLQIEYDLVNLSGDVPVTIDLYDLAGVKRCEVAHSTAASGRFSATWEGVDDAGNLLPPGLYLLRLEVDSDKAKDVEVAVVRLVY